MGQYLFHEMERFHTKMLGLSPKEYCETYINLLKALNENKLLNETDAVVKNV